MDEPPQPTPLRQALPTVPTVEMMVDNPVVHKVYWIHLKYPSYLNDDSPQPKPQPRPLLATEHDTWHTINAPVVTGNVRTASRHLGLLVHYDPTTKIGALFIGTGAEPDQPQRFVPWRGTRRLPKQPPRPLIPDPTDAFMQHPGFLNFSHLICARVIQQGELGVGNFFPGLVHVKEIVAQTQVLHTYLPLESMTYLKDLHEAYWSGVRYSDSGEVISLGHWGGIGGAGGSGGGQHGTHGRHGPSPRAQRISDPVDPATGLSHSTLMHIAGLQAAAADAQAQLAAGELLDVSEHCVVALFPLVDTMISRCDPFPVEVVSKFSPDSIH